MENLNTPSKVYIKSNNDSNKIINKYNISLILFSIITIIINILINKKELTISLIKSLILSFIITSIIAYIINLIKKEKDILKLYKEDTIIAISIIIAFFSINTNIYILVISILITLIIKNIIKNINISSSLYGILVILIYKYITKDINTPLSIAHSLKYNLSYGEIIKLDGGIKSYLFGITNLNPVASVLAFIYLFHKKATKYPLIFSYIISFSLMMVLYGIFNKYGLWFSVFEILTGYTLFLSAFTLSDYKITPTIKEGNVLYGIILAIFSVIARIIIPELSVIIVFIVAPLLLTSIIDKISSKLKYNHKLYVSLIITLSIVMILLTGVLAILI